MEFIYYCWSNLHKQVVNRIHIVDYIATNGKNIITIDFYLIGYIKLFRLSKNGKAVYYITNNLFMTFEVFQEVKSASWRIEEFHRGIKQCCNIEISSLEGNFQYWGLYRYL